MKLFICQYCGQLLYFENTRCERCSHSLGFLSYQNDLLTLTLTPIEDKIYADVAHTENLYRYCANAEYEACNWVLPVDSPDEYCVACKLNHTIPNLTQPEFVQHWRKLEIAKHRLVYTLLRLGLPVSAKAEDNDTGLAFDFLAEEDSPQKVIMGHAQGLITINVAEADEAKRVRAQQDLGEPYRTLLGHFRHESGHFYWDKLIATSPERLKNFRAMFGDERADYGEALKCHYRQGPTSDWSDHFVSSYASAHPWEDWAETWAHYLHIMDTLETAHSFGMRVKPAAVSKVEMLATQYSEDPFRTHDFQHLVDLWIPLTVAVNSLNRSMGQPDLYPFIIPVAVIEKLNFIHQLCNDERSWMSEIKDKRLHTA